ncbi:exonuclease V a 5' deoxyribonuclease-domain-containing protein [Mycena galopus ATCC 62051]|nr:exonuclease V a 5' deoxyribonuclease-domain-containing protein [Mycena galopus ATCC 62051]
MPSTYIELEGSFPDAEDGSPFQRYRPGGTLFVTDLTSLAWMEQTRIRRSADRPPSFRAESDKDILVQQDVAARNYNPTKRGQVLIHKELERELRAEEIEVETNNKEEQWTIRLINFLSCLVSLRAEGRAREIPVFGIVDGVVVVGRIDELLVRDQSGPKTGTKRAADSSLPPPKRTRRGPSAPSCEQELIAAPLAPTPSPQCIRLIDTKTRYTDSMPSDEDAVPAQLQVMLYHRLLSRLIDTSNLFDFSALWALLGMQPSASFSPTFLGQAAPIFGGPQSVPRCLEDMVLFVKTRLIELDLPRVEDTVQIIYLSQNKYLDRRRRAKGKSPQETTYTAATCEDDETAKAVPMSPEDMSGVELVAAPGENTDLAAALEENADLSEDEETAKAIQMSLEDISWVELAAAPEGNTGLAAALEESAELLEDISWVELAAAPEENTGLAAALEESADLFEDDETAKAIQMSLEDISWVELAAAPEENTGLAAALEESRDLSEDDETAKAIQMSLEDISWVKLAAAPEENTDLAAALEEIADLSEDEETAKAIQMSLDDTFGIELAVAPKEDADLSAALEENADLVSALEESADLTEDDETAKVIQMSLDNTFDVELAATPEEDADLAAALEESVVASALKRVQTLLPLSKRVQTSLLLSKRVQPLRRLY